MCGGCTPTLYEIWPNRIRLSFRRSDPCLLEQRTLDTASVPRNQSNVGPLFVGSGPRLRLTNNNHNFFRKAATSAVSFANRWFTSNLKLFAGSSTCTFPSTLAFTCCITPSLYTLIKQARIHHTTHAEPNINRKQLTHIHSYHDTPITIYVKALHCFQQFSL